MSFCLVFSEWCNRLRAPGAADGRGVKALCVVDCAILVRMTMSNFALGLPIQSE
jgi:hypothetical protein